MKKIGVENQKNECKIRDKIYFGYGLRLFVFTFLFLIFLILMIYFIINLCVNNQATYINYFENSNLDYKVYLKENNFYESDFLGKDMLYVANLIDKISIDFNYKLDFDKNIDMNFKYDIIAKLIINDKDGKNTYFSKEYVLLKDKEIDSMDTDNHIINENIVIDYSYYNNISNNFKSLYNLDTDSNLIVYFNIDRYNNDDKYNFNMGDSRNMYINIPLSEKSVNISMDYKNIENNLRVVDDSNSYIDDVIYLILIAISFVGSFIFLTKMIRLLVLPFSRKSNFEKYLNKILNEYDRLIVETTSCPIFKSKKIIEINKFSELLDVRDNLKLPIMYYVVAKNHKCYFYISHYNNIYLLILKAVDFDEK